MKGIEQIIPLRRITNNLSRPFALEDFPLFKGELSRVTSVQRGEGGSGGGWQRGTPEWRNPTKSTLAR